LSKVLVTGASGFLGGGIARRLLARGDQVRVLQRSDSAELRALGADVRQADLANRDAVIAACAGVDAVIHCAAKAGHWGSYESYYSANVLGTENILAAVRAHGIHRLVYTSTPSVAHAGGDLLGVDESAPIPKHFAAHYPATKAIAEQAVLAANSAQLATCALRPHLIWGPNDQHLLPRLIARARAGRLRFVGTPKLIDTIYIDNAVDAHVLALDRLNVGGACAGKAYFLSNDEPLPLDAVVNRLLECAGIAPVHKRVPVWLAKSVGAVLEVCYQVLPLAGEPIMTRFVAEQLSTAHYYDIRAAKRDLGYRVNISIDEGMRRLKAALQS
jgi:2-alkyl-3-oxoalkanoate reductase